MCGLFEWSLLFVLKLLVLELKSLELWIIINCQSLCYLFSGPEEAVIRNIGACKQSAEAVYGPIGMHKMVINHLGRLFVTNDAATIIRELDVSIHNYQFSLITV